MLSKSIINNSSLSFILSTLLIFNENKIVALDGGKIRNVRF